MTTGSNSFANIFSYLLLYPNSGVPVIEMGISCKEPANTFNDLLTATIFRNGIPLISPFYSDTISKFFSLSSFAIMLSYKHSRFVKTSKVQYFLP
jgi:hypothetical protein